ncbi:MAG: ABC transporter ATP-binding protein [Myxococcales bacterium FL481]|nr:MAG: ABC transporter ATP-binding protein [Myxococcales bacterium FL481]
MRLEAQQLTKKFGTLTALDRLDLCVGAGEIKCLLGANGAGKTTTINLFLGFLEPTSGVARVEGLDVARSPQQTKRHLAYIPERVALYPQLTGVENLEFFLRLAGQQPSSRELDSALESAGLDPKAGRRRAGLYSKGMRQKVGLAIALAKDAAVLLLDEPLSGLDPVAANTLCATLQQLKRDGRAVLMATHDVFRAKEVGTRIGIMKAGRLVETLDTKSLTAGEIEKIYLEHMHDGGESTALDGASA